MTMNKLLLTTAIILIAYSTLFSQVFDSLAVISPGNQIQDLTSKDNTLFAAVGAAGVMYSDDEGYTWNSCTPLPDAGFGQEWAFSIYAASNGDLIVGGNLVYNNAAFSGVVFRSSDDGDTWTAINFEGLDGYEESGKIIELSDGNLMMQGGFQKFFISSLTNPNWTQTNAPGGVIFGFEQIDDIIFAVNNPAGGTAGTWTTTDMGATWYRYGSNSTPVGQGTVTIAPVIKSGNHKFIGIGGTYDPKGIYRSGVNDTLWVEKNNGINESGIYPICMATDNVSIWMVMQNIAGTCMFTSTADYGENWDEPVTGLPIEGGASPCIEKMIVFGADLYTYSNESVFRKEDVAIPVSVSENLTTMQSAIIYPNPVKDQLNIRFNDAVDHVKLEILNLQGQLLKSASISLSTTSYSANVSDLKSGVYMVVLKSRNEIQTQKFIKN